MQVSKIDQNLGWVMLTEISLKQRAKHIKCGEEEPSCTNCVTKGLRCYGRDTDHSSRIIRPVYLDIDHFRSTFLRATPSSPFDRLEQHALYFFQNQTLPLLCAVFPSQIWAQALLAVAQSVPAIKHLVIAISAYHLAQHTRSTTEASNSAMMYALQNYTKATRSVREIIDSEKPPIKIIKLACIIFIILEYLRGDRQATVLHLSIGMRLLNYSRCFAELDSFERDIDCTLSGLSFIQSLHGRPRDSQLPALGCLPEPMVDATPFASISEARASIMHLCSRSFRISRQMEEQQSPLQSPDALSEQNQLMTQFQLWSTKVDKITINNEADEKAIELLKAYHINSHIALLTSTTQYQTSFDQYNSMFRSVIDILDRVVDSLLSPSGEPVPFSVNLAIIPCLFFAVTKCRHPQMRRRALSILRRAPQREGLWDARQAALVAEHVIKLEEQRLEEGRFEKYCSIPEEDRVHYVDIRQMTSDNKFSLCIIFKRRPYATCVDLEESFVYI